MVVVPVRQLSETSIESLRTMSPHLSRTLTTEPAALGAALPAVAEDLDPELSRCVPRSPHGVLVLRGLPFDVNLGPTPPHWSHVATGHTDEWAAQLLLLASALGRPLGWEGQQDGRLVHDIVPTKGEEQDQTGASSSVELSPHTEDAFHPARANLLMLSCARNPDRVATYTACVRHTDLDPDDRDVLSRPTLPILPDSAYAEAQRSDAPPVPVATLWDAGAGLGLRYDPAYTPLSDGEPAYLDAYLRLREELDRVAVRIRLAPGDVLVIDNDAAVHGRESFRARFDGTDRWLRRVSVRVPGRQRPAAEATEHGYGQRVLDPCLT